MTLADTFALTYVALIAIAFALIAWFGSRSARRQQWEMDAEYAEEKALSDSASQWPEGACHWCGTTDTPLDRIDRCDYCAELHKLTGPVRDPRFAPFRMTLIR
jgi:hypothetical protein